MSFFGKIYETIYGAMCGRHPNLLPWHFQWHALRNLQRDLHDILGGCGGDVLDLGCGRQPYRSWFGSAKRYVAADIEELPGVDVKIVPGEPLPFGDRAFDTILATQVFEHVAELEPLVAEIERVVRPGAILVVSVPFIYGLHGKPHDYRRFSEYGIAQAICGLEVVEMRRQGGIGSTLAVLMLAWLDTQANAHVVTRFAKALLLPVWIAFSAAANLLGWAFDAVDTTNSYYGNILVAAKKSGRSLVGRR